MLPPMGTIIPMYLQMNHRGLLDTHLDLTMPCAALSTPQGAWMVKSFVDDIAIVLKEAAMIADCFHLSALYGVILPLILLGCHGCLCFSLSLEPVRFGFGTHCPAGDHSSLSGGPLWLLLPLPCSGRSFW